MATWVQEWFKKSVRAPTVESVSVGYICAVQVARALGAGTRLLYTPVSNYRARYDTYSKAGEHAKAIS